MRRSRKGKEPHLIALLVLVKERETGEFCESCRRPSRGFQEFFCERCPSVNVTNAAITRVDRIFESLSREYFRARVVTENPRRHHKTICYRIAGA